MLGDRGDRCRDPGPDRAKYSLPRVRTPLDSRSMMPVCSLASTRSLHRSAERAISPSGNWTMDTASKPFGPLRKRAAESAWMRDKIIAEVPSTALQVHVQQILLYNEQTAESFLIQLNGGTDFDDAGRTGRPTDTRRSRMDPAGVSARTEDRGSGFQFGSWRSQRCDSHQRWFSHHPRPCA